MIEELFHFDRVMLIDDTQIDRYVAAFTIKKHHFGKQVTEFDMGKKALDYLLQNKDNPEVLPQIILLDIRMPEMDGFQFLEEINQVPQIYSNCTIVMISSSLDPEDHEKASKNKFVKLFINKPLCKDKLDEIVAIKAGLNIQK